MKSTLKDLEENTLIERTCSFVSPRAAPFLQPLLKNCPREAMVKSTVVELVTLRLDTSCSHPANPYYAAL